ncbi:MAG: ABC transporter ATP-binding protein [Clostridia bacterium]|nr:ABC transporter ATP-binding protein [Clostridia bacterium]MEE1054292.1 ABC transporter ATP-binding protein [Acutalibacteraceae bacterium]
MLKIEHLTKKYGKVYANNDISFEIPDGSITVLLGPNGAGKSTVIKSVIGFLKYDGIITVDGQYNKSPEAKRLLGYVPELPALYPNLTVGEHLEFVARAYRLKDYKDYKNELLERFELTDKVKKFGDELSKGMQQKLSICCALLPCPKVLLFDEPMIGLDPHAIKELKNLFIDMRSKGCSILISTHMIDSIDMLWDRTIIMQNGTVTANVTKEELDTSSQTLEELFFNTTEGEAL